MLKENLFTYLTKDDFLTSEALKYIIRECVDRTLNQVSDYLKENNPEVNLEDLKSSVLNEYGKLKKF